MVSALSSAGPCEGSSQDRCPRAAAMCTDRQRAPPHVAALHCARGSGRPSVVLGQQTARQVLPRDRGPEEATARLETPVQDTPRSESRRQPRNVVGGTYVSNVFIVCRREQQIVHELSVHFWTVEKKNKVKPEARGSRRNMGKT